MSFCTSYLISITSLKIFFIFLFLYVITVTFIIYFTPNNNEFMKIEIVGSLCNNNNHNTNLNNVTNYLKLPHFDNYDIKTVNTINAQLVNQSINSTLIDKVAALDELSFIIQKQLKSMEDVIDCNQATTLLCGHQDVCGFGCQLHHRMACVMLSYVVGIPLIHEKGGWPYSKAWNDVFEPIGTACSPGPKTLKVRWRRKNEKVTNNLITGDISLLRKSHTCKYNCSVIEYPFKHGIVVPEFIGNVVDSLHENPFAWWMGQFSKYVLRLKANELIEIEDWKKEIFPKSQTSPIIGMHIRRTDKSSEAKLIPIESYFKEAKNINLPEFQNVSIRNIFIASDASHEVLAEAKRKYNSPEWNIFGFGNQTTLNSQTGRKNALDEIIRDVFLLSECDYVICTMSSQVCRVVLEIMSSKRINSFSRVKSLDNKYGFGLCCGFAVPPVVIKV